MAHPIPARNPVVVGVRRALLVATQFRLAFETGGLGVTPLFNPDAAVAEQWCPARAETLAAERRRIRVGSGP